MAITGKVRINQKGWDTVVKQIVDEYLVPAAEAIASQCNSEAGITDGYRAGTEGAQSWLTLKRHDYRATVITATPQAMADNAKHQRLINNLTI
jgi:hypothetical protein